VGRHVQGEAPGRKSVVSCLGSAGFCREVWGTAALFIKKKKDHRLCSWVRLDRCRGGTEVGGFCVESSIGPWRLGVWSMETPVVLGFCFVSVDFFLLLQEQFFGRLRIFSEDASVV